MAQQPGAARTAARVRATPHLLSGARPNIATIIQGNALSSTNGALPDATIRLRDARLGRIVDTQLSDKSGLFTFKGVDPGNYIVEIVGSDQTVLAASQMLSVNGGEAVSAVVKLPFRIPPFAGLLGNSAPSAAAVTTEAAASSILAITTTANASSAEPPTAAAPSR